MSWIVCFTIKLLKRFTDERDEAWTRADEKEIRTARDPLQRAQARRIARTVSLVVQAHR
ncbi:MAG TPA: hypothetical protein VII66_02930 [Gemmatimonadaceae bacterium]